MKRLKPKKTLTFSIGKRKIEWYSLSWQKKILAFIFLLILILLLTLMFLNIKNYLALASRYGRLRNTEIEEEQSIKKYDNSNNFKISSCECQGRINQKNTKNSQERKIWEEDNNSSYMIFIDENDSDKTNKH